MVAFQLLYDYLDAVNELPDSTDLRNGLQLHGALTDAVVPDRPLRDYYLHNPAQQDGGYVLTLADICRRTIRTLPSTVNIVPILARVAERCGQAQSHNHAIATEGEHGLIGWCQRQAPDGDYLWWEISAGGISCLAIHALFALAAEPQRTIEDAARLDAAYFPPICAISALLDSLADHHSDAGTTNHSFTARYRDGIQAGERLSMITRDAVDRVSGLHNRCRHIMVLCGVVAFYLSSPSVGIGFPSPVAENLMLSIGPLMRPMLTAMRLRRYKHVFRQNSHDPE
jgi:tetraprenyl-beta-curcumene synthase